MIMTISIKRGLITRINTIRNRIDSLDQEKLDLLEEMRLIRIMYESIKNEIIDSEEINDNFS